MADWIVLFFAFAMGMAVSGVAASALGAPVNVRAGFHPPFVTRERLALSLAITAVAGPVMLFNDAMRARRSGAIGVALLGACLTIAAVWALALGILATELAWRAGLLVT